MSKEPWVSDTDAEYIFDYREDISKLDTDDVRITIDAQGHRFLNVTRGGVLVVNALQIKTPKKPWNTLGESDFGILSDFFEKLEEFKSRLKKDTD